MHERHRHALQGCQAMSLFIEPRTRRLVNVAGGTSLLTVQRNNPNEGVYVSSWMFIQPMTALLKQALAQCDTLSAISASAVTVTRATDSSADESEPAAVDINDAS